jgi:hypothetical protein
MTSRDSAVGPEPRVRSGARRGGHGSDLAEEGDVVEAVPPLDDAVSAEAQDGDPVGLDGLPLAGTPNSSPLWVNRRATSSPSASRFWAVIVASGIPERRALKNSAMPSRLAA